MSGLPSWAVPDRKVVCVDASCSPGTHWTADDGMLVEGEVYTITGSGFDPFVTRPTIYLAEIARGATARSKIGGDWGYWVGRFRPLISQADDLETHFVHLLDAPLNHEREEA